LDSAIRTHAGPDKLTQLKRTVRDIAIGELPAQEKWEKVIKHLRHGATITGLGLNIGTALLQPFGLTQSMVRIGPKWVAKGLAKWIGDAARMESVVSDIYAKSTAMRFRGKTMQRNINEMINQVSGKISAVETASFLLIQKMQVVADVPTWLGAYEKAMSHDNMSEDRAIAMADQAVVDSQGSGQIKDLSSVQRGAEFKKVWTNFYSFFNTTYQLTVERTKATNFKSPMQVAALAVDYMLLYVVPAVLGTLLKAALKGEDEEEIAKNLARDQLNYLFGTMIGLREIGAAVQGFQGYSGPAGTRFFSELTKLATQAEQGEIDEAALKAFANTFGVVFHLPTGQVTRTVDGIHALSTGKTNHLGALVAGSQEN
jgi:hypothetical protein